MGWERMLRIHFVQHGFNLANFACKEALYDSTSLRRFVGIDLEMHQTRKGKQWYWGMKLHIGVDSQSGLAHSAVVTPVNLHDQHPLPKLLHGQEQGVYGDSAYASQKALIRRQLNDFAVAHQVLSSAISPLPGVASFGK